MSSRLLSDVLGWISIGCWLGAQFPQVLENIRRQSCEGLALPFLLNWLLGDFTNLIGCVLTHQLPFQTILATYFVSVDFMLFSQYFYYRRRSTKLESVGPGSAASSPVQHYGTHRQRLSTEHEHHYRELSNAAANVALAAALAASEEELHVHVAKEDTTRRPMHRRTSTSITRSEAAEAEDEVDEAALAALADSFHSESGRKRVSWSEERYASGGRGGSTSRTRTSGRVAAVPPLTPLHTASILGSAGDNSTGVMNVRGRPLQRQIIESPLDVNDLEEAGDAVRRSLSRSVMKARRSSRASQRSVGLVFLGVWALFGIGRFSQISPSITSSHGVVLSQAPQTTPLYQALDSPLSIAISEPISVSSGFEQRTNNVPEEPSSERIIGRIFAWACTTLYLTSRLPQIWKNFVRKSVEGLSMYLFVFAFLGNTFYVMSILSSPMMSLPRPASTAFLLESMPYLLGSGGTLLFDVTIVCQSFLYRPGVGHAAASHIQGHGHHHHRHHHRSTRSSYSQLRADSHIKSSTLYGSMDSVPEEQALLRSDAAVRDLEREAGLGLGFGDPNEWASHARAQTRRRRDKDTDDGSGSETVS